MLSISANFAVMSSKLVILPGAFLTLSIKLLFSFSKFSFASATPAFKISKSIDTGSLYEIVYWVDQEDVHCCAIVCIL